MSVSFTFNLGCSWTLSIPIYSINIHSVTQCKIPVVAVVVSSQCKRWNCILLMHIKKQTYIIVTSELTLTITWNFGGFEPWFTFSKALVFDEIPVFSYYLLSLWILQASSDVNCFYKKLFTLKLKYFYIIKSWNFRNNTRKSLRKILPYRSRRHTVSLKWTSCWVRNHYFLGLMWMVDMIRRCFKLYLL